MPRRWHCGWLLLFLWTFIWSFCGGHMKSYFHFLKRGVRMQMKYLSSSSRGTARSQCEDNITNPPSGYGCNYSSIRRSFVPNILFTLSFLSLIACVCGFAVPTVCGTEVFPFKNKLVYLEKRLVMAVSNWIGLDSDVM